MNKMKFKHLWAYGISCVKWIALAVAVGVAGGIIGSIFHHFIDYATGMRQQNWWIILLLPAGGLLITVLNRLSRSKGKMDTNRVIEAAGGSGDVPLVMIPLIFIGTVITHLFGGSSGREGAALQIGGSVGYNTGRLFRLGENELHTMIMAGMSAVFTALFGTPLTASVFAIEVISVGSMRYSALLPCLVASAVAYFMARFGFNITPVAFELACSGEVTGDVLVKVFVLGVLCAFVSTIFCLSIKYTEKYLKNVFPNDYIRSILGGFIIVLLTFAVGSREYNGAGMDVINRAVSGNARYEAFILKIVFTAITIAAGFKGGEIVPTFFIGATFGSVAGGFLGIDPSLGAAIGMAAMFCGVTNCPIASMLLAVELFGGKALLCFALACGVSFVFSGYSGLYKSQKFIFSKTCNEIKRKID